MKLIGIYIYGYGKLNNYKLDFNESLTSINESNGFGKSTILSFIKSMLYGMKEATKSIETNPRLHYYPWDNVKFGGELVLDINNRKYKIIREFGKSSKDDTFRLIDLDTNLDSNLYTENIGEEILGLNSDSFQRSVYLSEDQSNGINHDLKSKLIKLVGGSDDIANLEDALKALNNKDLAIYKGKDALYKKDKSRSLELMSIIEKTQAELNTIDRINEGITRINEDIKVKEDRKKELSQILDNHEIYISQSTMIKSLEIHQSHIDRVEGYIKEKKALLNDQDINPDEYKDIKEKLVRLHENENRSYALNIKAKEARYNELDEHLHSVNDNDINNIEAIYNDYKKNESKSKASKLSIVLIILSIMLFIAGAILLFMNKMNIAILILFTGVIALIGFVFTLLSKPKNKNKESEGKLREFFGSFGMFSDDFGAYLNAIKSTYDEYKNLNVEIDDLKKKEYNLNKDIEYLRDEVSRYLNRFRLKSSTLDEKMLEIKEILRDLDQYNMDIKRAHTDMDQFKRENNLENMVVDNVKYDYDAIKKELAQLDRELLEYNGKRSQITERIKSINERQEILNDSRDELNTLMNNMTKYEEAHNNIELAKQYLEKASIELVSKFVGPVKDNMTKYLSIIDEYKDFIIDADFNFKDNNNHELAYLSKGYKDIIYFCMRLAVIDSIYKDNLPPIILDDPFSSYDPKHLEDAKRILEVVKEKYQIIYITCHTSREV